MVSANNMVRARVRIKGTRPLLQHAFTEAAIPLEKEERSGVAGNDPTEWKKTCLVTDAGQLYVLPSYIFSAIREGSKHTRKGKSSYQALVAATLQVEEPIVLLNRWMPKGGEPTRDRTAPVYLDVCGVRNPSTKGRNIRYRLATSAGWECEFTLLWDKTVVPREVMRTALRDTGVLVGLADGRSVGNGRFAVLSWEELAHAEEAAAEGSVAETPSDHVGKGRKKVRAVPEAAEVDGIAP